MIMGIYLGALMLMSFVMMMIVKIALTTTRTYVEVLCCSVETERWGTLSVDGQNAVDIGVSMPQNVYTTHLL
ncbi:hypothetical protein BA896_012265 [Janthinobacterium lividum]|uniref:Uncharacterized protein n=1 Tax=Janthinobacterium lividum TaxID=29581 RepID=A0A1E8PTL6_9BURK|nr:hypothetical protein BA896_012265 [Janthinobacterium lividum]